MQNRVLGGGRLFERLRFLNCRYEGGSGVFVHVVGSVGMMGTSLIKSLKSYRSTLIV